MSEQDFVVKRTRRDVVVFIIGREGHAHFPTYQGAYIFIKLMAENKLPKKRYFRKAARRVLNDEEYKGLREPRQKQKYVNKR